MGKLFKGVERRGFTCPKYTPLPGGKRCQHYVQGGSCALPDEFMCVEWLKRNAPEAHAVDRSRARGAAVVAELAAGMERAVADAVAPTTVGGPPSAPAAPGATLGATTSVALDALTDEALVELAATGYEMQVSTFEVGEVWLVPSYTDQSERTELTFRDARTLLLCATVFPKAQVVGLRRLTKKAKEARDERASDRDRKRIP